MNMKTCYNIIKNTKSKKGGKEMTVKELIKQLEKLPEGARVMAWNKEMWRLQGIERIQFDQWDNLVILHDE